MQLSLNIGTIYIQDQEIVKFIQNKSIDEIKKMFIDFLNEQVNLISNDPIKKIANGQE